MARHQSNTATQLRHNLLSKAQKRQSHCLVLLQSKHNTGCCCTCTAPPPQAPQQPGLPQERETASLRVLSASGSLPFLKSLKLPLPCSNKDRRTSKGYKNSKPHVSRTRRSAALPPRRSELLVSVRPHVCRAPPEQGNRQFKTVLSRTTSHEGMLSSIISAALHAFATKLLHCGECRRMTAASPDAPDTPTVCAHMRAATLPLPRTSQARITSQNC